MRSRVWASGLWRVKLGVALKVRRFGFRIHGSGSRVGLKLAQPPYSSPVCARSQGQAFMYNACCETDSEHNFQLTI